MVIFTNDHVPAHVHIFGDGETKIDLRGPGGRWIPQTERPAHEFCYFLHDSCVQVLGEYEGAKAHLVHFKFRDEGEAGKFEVVADREDAVAALHAIGRSDEARRVVIKHRYARYGVGLYASCI